MAGQAVTISETLHPLIEKIGGKQRAIIFGVGIVVAAGIFGVTRWATAPEWVPAFSDIPMEATSEMTERLEQSGIPFRLERGGSEILVTSENLARARVTLAKDGLPVRGRPGLELFDQPSWGMTDFTQRINYRRALEGELERTISQMRGVQGAQVHLALHEQANFRRQDKPANASVVLKTVGNIPPTPEVVLGISHLVAGSVDGLTSDRVTVIDDSGRLLSMPGGQGSLTALTNSQLAMQRDIESYLQLKAEALLNDMVGVGNARIRVNAALNFDKIDRQSQIIDPDRQAASTEQRHEIPGIEGEGGGSSNIAISYENTRIMESFSGSIGDIKKLSVAVLINDQGSETTGGSDLTHIESLVKSAVGADDMRGDIVTVVLTPFELNNSINAFIEPETEAEDTISSLGVNPLYYALAALLVIAAAAHLYIRHRAKQKAEFAALLAAATAEQEAQTALKEAEPHLLEEEPRGEESLVDFLNRSNIQRTVVTTIESKPDVAARALRIWMKEGTA